MTFGLHVGNAVRGAVCAKRRCAKSNGARPRTLAAERACRDRARPYGESGCAVVSSQTRCVCSSHLWNGDRGAVCAKTRCAKPNRTRRAPEVVITLQIRARGPIFLKFGRVPGAGRAASKMSTLRKWREKVDFRLRDVRQTAIGAAVERALSCLRSGRQGYSELAPASAPARRNASNAGRRPSRVGVAGRRGGWRSRAYESWRAEGETKEICL